MSRNRRWHHSTHMQITHFIHSYMIFYSWFNQTLKIIFILKVSDITFYFHASKSYLKIKVNIRNMCASVPEILLTTKWAMRNYCFGGALTALFYFMRVWNCHFSSLALYFMRGPDCEKWKKYNEPQQPYAVKNFTSVPRSLYESKTLSIQTVAHSSQPAAPFACTQPSAEKVTTMIDNARGRRVSQSVRARRNYKKEGRRFLRWSVRAKNRCIQKRPADFSADAGR